MRIYNSIHVNYWRWCIAYCSSIKTSVSVDFWFQSRLWPKVWLTLGVPCISAYTFTWFRFQVKSSKPYLIDL